MKKKDEPLTPDEAKSVLAILDRTWIPNSAYDSFTSAIAKLAFIAAAPPRR